MPAREHEHTLNVWLAELLRERGVDAKQESSQGGRRIDVDVRVGSVKIAIEAEQGQNAAKTREAIGDADRRLEQGLADCAIAVCYPDGIAKREDMARSTLMWNILTPPLTRVKSTTTIGGTRIWMSSRESSGSRLCNWAIPTMWRRLFRQAWTSA